MMADTDSTVPRTRTTRLQVQVQQPLTTTTTTRPSSPTTPSDDGTSILDSVIVQLPASYVSAALRVPIIERIARFAYDQAIWIHIGFMLLTFTVGNHTTRGRHARAYLPSSGAK
jgi:hypothetical protein